jgi:cytochrome d ubiquinol oxidase subunit I
VVIFETKYYKTDDLKYKRLSEFFGDIFIINYAFGIVTGIVMTVQFGTNWSAYTNAMGEVFGSPLLLEALIAFFLESTFAGIWTFRRNKISKKFRLFTVWMINIGVTLSALWIITANGFMQNPVGMVFNAETMTVQLLSFREIVFNPYTWYMLIHNHLSAILLTAVVVLAISAYHIGRNHRKEEFMIVAKFSSWVLLISGILMPITGYTYMNFINTVQPDKIAMIQTGLSQNDLVSDGLAAWVRIAFNIMVTSGTFFIALGAYMVIFFDKVMNSNFTRRLLYTMVPLPYIAIMTGWMVTEMGRQPWIIYGRMRVYQGISVVPVEQVWFSLMLLAIFYTMLYFMAYYLTIKRIRKGISEDEATKDNTVGEASPKFVEATV